MRIDFEKTKEYKTRDGRKAVIKCKYSDRYHHSSRNFGDIDGIVCYWHDTGSTVNGSLQSAPTDIIDVWEKQPEKPVVDWSLFPEHIQFLALNSTGNWFGYTCEPVRSFHGFEKPAAAYSSKVLIRVADRPTFSGDWKDSLIKRPSNIIIVDDIEDDNNETDF